MDVIQKYKKDIKQSFEKLLEEGVITKDEQNMYQVYEGSQNQHQNNAKSNIRQASTKCEKTQKLGETTSCSNLDSQVETNSEQANVVQNMHNHNPYKQQKYQQNKTSQSKCVVCSKRNPKYRCPQCQILYCSADHYKTHNLFCSQSFFQKQVQNTLKGMKSTKSDKQKTINLLKQHQELMQDEQGDMSSRINQDRFLQILNKIQEKEKQGEQLTVQQGNKILTLEEQKQLLKYIQKVKIQQQKQLPKNVQDNYKGANFTNFKMQQQQKVQSSLELNKPFWEINEGLDFYYFQSIQIQEFSQAKYPEIIAFREEASKKYKNLPLFQTLAKVPPSNLLVYDLLQHIVIGTTFFNMFNSDYMNHEFIDYFCSCYEQNICKSLKQSNIQSSCLGELAFSIIKYKMNEVRSQNQDRNQLLIWYEVSLNDCKVILKNKFLVVEFFIRLLESFEKQYRRQCKIQQNYVKDSLDKGEQKKDYIFKWNKNKPYSKRYRNTILKLLKKIQYILSYFRQQSQTIQQGILRNISKQIMIQEKKEQQIKSDRRNYEQANKLAQLMKRQQILVPQKR